MIRLLGIGIKLTASVDGAELGASEGDADGAELGTSDGDADGTELGALDGH